MTRGNHYGRPLSVAIEAGALVIRIGAATLAHAASYADWANPFDEDANDYIRTFAITDAAALAADVRDAMLREAEDGSSPLSDFLDRMTQNALDDGSTACEYEQRIKHGERAASETWAAGNDAELPRTDCGAMPIASSPLRRVLGLSPHIPEGRATFDALVPDRYKQLNHQPRR